MIIRKQIIKSVAQQIASESKKQEPVKQHRKGFPKIKKSTIAIYASVFLLVVVMVFTSYQSPTDSSLANASNNTKKIDTTSVDDVLAANIAARIARAANLPIANNVTNLAISAQIKSDYIQSNGSTVARPRIIGSAVEGRSIKSYTVQYGDTIEGLSARFGITVDTIKWANNLQYDTLTEGTVLQILPIDGVIYDVQYGDTVDSIATRYSVDKERLILYNDLDVSGLIPNTKIILPNAIMPEDERPGYIAYYVTTGTTGNMNDYGYCTWYAFERRAELGMPIQSPWGNADAWAWSAAASGFLVDNTPAFGAVLVDESGYEGHVAVVERVEANGDIFISEMNYSGWNVINTRTISAGQAALYKYIH